MLRCFYAAIMGTPRSLKCQDMAASDDTDGVKIHHVWHNTLCRSSGSQRRRSTGMYVDTLNGEAMNTKEWEGGLDSRRLEDGPNCVCGGSRTVSAFCQRQHNGHSGLGRPLHYRSRDPADGPGDWLLGGREVERGEQGREDHL